LCTIDADVDCFVVDGDCDDADSDVHPGGIEVDDTASVDEDCDGWEKP
jgi:hypothetical protein